MPLSKTQMHEESDTQSGGYEQWEIFMKPAFLWLAWESTERERGHTWKGDNMYRDRSKNRRWTSLYCTLAFTGNNLIGWLSAIVSEKCKELLYSWAFAIRVFWVALTHGVRFSCRCRRLAVAV